MVDQAHLVHVLAESGPAFWGPGDCYTFLVTGEQSGGAYFILEALVPPHGGQPPHIHHREEESFYLLQGTLTLTVGERQVRISAGDFVQIPRGTVHTFTNDGVMMARMLAIFTPAGMEHYFTDALSPAIDRMVDPPPATPELFARMIAAAPRHGVEFV